MPKSKTISVGEVDVRVDLESGFMCITDLAGVRGNASDNIKNWMRTLGSINFFEAWEREHNPEASEMSFDRFRIQAADVTFTLTATRLLEAGCTGIFVRRGRSGGTYCHIDWATHFANWLDARFYVLTLKVARELSDRIYGRDASHLRFARELAAETYPLVTGAALSALPPAADALFEKRVASVEADILNLALWGMTAQEWRIKFPQSDARKNMRDYATPEELKTLSALQVLSQEMHENGYSSEERLDRLRAKAQELIQRFCAKTDKQDLLLLAQHKRGWGKFEF